MYLIKIYTVATNYCHQLTNILTELVFFNQMTYTEFKYFENKNSDEQGKRFKFGVSLLIEENQLSQNICLFMVVIGK